MSDQTYAMNVTDGTSPVKFGPYELTPKSLDSKGQPLFSKDDIEGAMIRMAFDLPKEITPLMRTAQEAAQVVSTMVDGFAERMRDFRQDTKSYLVEIQQTRYAVTHEVNAMLSGLKDVRAFFVGPNHDAEVEKLRVFVELCERLKALKDSGFLDAVADTIIRLG